MKKMQNMNMNMFMKKQKKLMQINNNYNKLNKKRNIFIQLKQMMKIK